MAEKTYNTGRVVGWSAYEEFLKETGADPNIITNYVYQTLVTYGVTRVVTLPADRTKWRQHQGDATFYTTTVRVPGASWGAVPIVGIHYDTYIDSFYNNGEGIYKEAKPEEAFDKQALEKAIGNIFTCYVSDANGRRAQSSISDSGYLTFAAYPDILNFMEEMQAYDEQFGGLQLIVRGLSMQDLDVDSLYYGPQGLLFAGNGLAEECSHETVDISGLALSASGYLWLDIGGNSGSGPTDHLSSKAGSDFRCLVNPHGLVLATSTGYVDLDWVLGENQYTGNGVYGFTYDEMRTKILVSDHPWYINTNRYDRIPESARNDYYYLISGSASYDSYPPGSSPFQVLPVNSHTGEIQVGDFSNPGINTDKQFKKQLDFTVSMNLDSKDAVLYLKDIWTNQYMGSYWPPLSSGYSKACGYTGQNYVMQPSQSKENTLLADATFYDYGKQSYFKVPGNQFRKGDTVLITHRTDAKQNGFYFCTSSVEWDGTESEPHNYSILNRRGAYLPTILPGWLLKNDENRSWIDNMDYYLDEVATAAGVVTDGVLYVAGNRVYPNELIWVRIANGDIEDTVVKVATAVRTIENNAPKLVCYRYDVRASVTVGGTITNQSTRYSSIIRVNKDKLAEALEHSVTYMQRSSTAVTTAVSDITPGTLLRVRHNQAGVYGEGLTYFYYVIEITSSYVRLASAEIYRNDPTLFTVTGIAGEYDSLVPRYKQYKNPDGTPNAADVPASWTYPMRTALAHLSAKEFFSDFGLSIADYVHEDYQNLSLGRFLQECSIRTNLREAATPFTLRSATISKTYHFYSKEDLHYDPNATPVIPDQAISSSITLSASISGSFFSTAYYKATDAAGNVLNINDPRKPMWATLAKSRSGDETTSLSLVDNEGVFLEFSGGLGTIEADKITWLDLMVGLGSGQSIDLLHGMVVRRTNSDCNYLITADGTRLYISTTEPIPGTGEEISNGSIGIGWSATVMEYRNGSWVAKS